MTIAEITRHNACLDAGDLKGAADALHSALAKQPEDHDLHALLSRTLAISGDLDAAEASAHRCLELAPDHPPCHAALAFTLMLKGQLEAADQAINRLQELAPDNQEAYALSVMIAERLKDDVLLEPRIKRFLTADPQAERAHLSWANFCYRSGDLGGARRSTKRALEINHESASAHFLISLMEAELQRFPEARAAVETALRYAPRHQQAQALLKRLPSPTPGIQLLRKLPHTLRPVTWMVLSIVGLVIAGAAAIAISIIWPDPDETIIAGLAVLLIGTPLALMESSMRRELPDRSKVFLNYDY